MKDKTPQQRGHEFQDDVQAELQSYHGKHKSVTLRLYDTKSAGGYLPSQPGDFISVHEGTAILVEAKSSEKCSSLSENRRALTSLFSDDQIAKMRIWKRAGARVVVIFQNQNTKLLEVWDGSYIAACYLTPKEHADIGYAFLFNNIPSAVGFILKGKM